VKKFIRTCGKCNERFVTQYPSYGTKRVGPCCSVKKWNKLPKVKLCEKYYQSFS
jgi:hypothetical protein